MSAGLFSAIGSIVGAGVAIYGIEEQGKLFKKRLKSQKEMAMLNFRAIEEQRKLQEMKLAHSLIQTRELGKIVLEATKMAALLGAGALAVSLVKSWT